MGRSPAAPKDKQSKVRDPCGKMGHVVADCWSEDSPKRPSKEGKPDPKQKGSKPDKDGATGRRKTVMMVRTLAASKTTQSRINLGNRATGVHTDMQSATLGGT